MSTQTFQPLDRVDYHMVPPGLFQKARILRAEVIHHAAKMVMIKIETPNGPIRKLVSPKHLRKSEVRE